jgi:16S rRNA (guanine1516-N2)-methyltransferase
MFKTSLAVLASDEKMSLIAKDLSLPLVSNISDDYAFFLMQAPEGLSLLRQGKQPAKLTIDFHSRELHYRRSQGGSELLIKAVGLHKKKGLNILDATAGLGRDAFMMASYHGSVTMIERNPLIALLLEDALARFFKEKQPKFSLKLIKQDSLSYLTSLIDVPDVIYLDPMFPEKKKSAKVKKDMAFLQQLLMDDFEPEKLLYLALEKVKERVVVKRPNYAGFLGEIKPTYSLIAKANRFDIYTRDL